MPLLETCTDHVRGEGFFTITAAETWSIAMVKRLKAKYPEEVEIRITNPDGSAILNFSAVAEAGWVGLPDFQLAKFDLTSILVMAPIAIASMMEHIGDISAISSPTGPKFRRTGPTPYRDTPGMRKAPCIHADQSQIQEAHNHPGGGQGHCTTAPSRFQDGGDTDGNDTWQPSHSQERGGHNGRNRPGHCPCGG